LRNYSPLKETQKACAKVVRQLAAGLPYPFPNPFPTPSFSCGFLDGGGCCKKLLLSLLKQLTAILAVWLSF